MAILLSFDVDCDVPGCSAWDGTTTGRQGSTQGLAAEVRKIVAGSGWTRRRINGRMHDLCPGHIDWDGQTAVEPSEPLRHMFPEEVREWNDAHGSWVRLV